MRNITSQISRRGFLGGAGSAALAATNVQLALATYPAARIPIGLELYTVDNALKEDFEGTLRRVAEIGYSEVEFPWYHGHTTSQVLSALKAAGLTCRSSLILPHEADADLPGGIEFAQALGLKYLGYVMMKVPERGANVAESLQKLTLDDFKRAAERLNHIGEQTKRAGIQLTYHNHDFEFMKFGDVVGFDQLLRGTDPELVKIELDVGWAARAGFDPVRYLREHPGRFALLHVRDFRKDVPYQVLRMNSVEVGQGVMDWKELFAAARTSGVKAGFVEQDPGAPEASFKSAKMSFDYLRKLSY